MTSVSKPYDPAAKALKQRGDLLRNVQRQTRKASRLTDEAELAYEQAVTREIYKADLFLTAYDLLGYKDLSWQTHGPVCEALQASTHRKLIILPRGCFKSSLCSVAYPIWCLLRDPNERILIDSELYSNSKNFLREIALHMQSNSLKDLWGRFDGTGTWNEGELIIAQRSKILKEASITASGIGATKVGMHYDRIIMDDMNSPGNSATKEGRAKVIDHYRHNTAILEPNGTLVVVGTRYSADDLPGTILKHEIEEQGLL